MRRLHRWRTVHSGLISTKCSSKAKAAVAPSRICMASQHHWQWTRTHLLHAWLKSASLPRSMSKPVGAATLGISGTPATFVVDNLTGKQDSSPAHAPSKQSWPSSQSSKLKAKKQTLPSHKTQRGSSCATSTVINMTLAQSQSHPFVVHPAPSTVKQLDSILDSLGWPRSINALLSKLT